MKAEVIATFIDAKSGKRYRPGDSFEADSKRVNKLANLGFVKKAKKAKK